jgi:outer membrane protein assembly factor BamB
MVFYFVQEGETLYAIARRYQTTVHAILSANRLEDPNIIAPGQALIIPRPGEVPTPAPGGILHLVRKGETVFHLADRFGVTAPEILRANQLAHPEFLQPGQQLVIPERLELAADWPMRGRTAGRTSASPIRLVGEPSLQWNFMPRRVQGAVPSAPIVRYGRTFAALGDGQLYSLDRHSGRVKWRHALATERMEGLQMATPCVHDGLIYAVEPGRALHALGAQSGRPVWRYAFEAASEVDPVAVDGMVYAVSTTGLVVALEGKTGALAWQRALGLPVRFPPAVGGDQLFLVLADGRVVTLAMETGEIDWEAPARAMMAPVFAELLLLVGGEAFDPKTGQIAWEVPFDMRSPVVKVDQVVYGNGMVDLFTGVGRERFDSALEGVTWHATAGNQVIGTDEAFLYGWEMEQGLLSWQVRLAGRPAHPPAVTRQQVLITLTDGGMASYAFRQEDDEGAG